MRRRAVLVLWAAIALACGPPAPPPPVEAPPPTLLLYVADALRASALGCYGQPDPVTPHVDRMSRSGHAAPDVRSHSSWTRPSIASLFTGLAPHVADGPGGDVARGASVASSLRARGFRTTAIVTNPMLGIERGFADGFDDYLVIPSADSADPFAGAAVLHAVGLDWLRSKADPVFLYLHASEPHAPYLAPEPFGRLLAPAVPRHFGDTSWLRTDFPDGPRPGPGCGREVGQLYLADVASLDAEIAILLARLRRASRTPLLLFTSDHGEELREHGDWEHGRSLYDEVLRVPLILAGPWPRTPPPGPINHVDLVPTMLARAGIAHAGPLPGRDIFAAGPRDAPAVSRLVLRGSITRAVVAGRFKLIHDGAPALYDLAEDPSETRDIAREHPAVVRRLSLLLPPAASPPDVDDEDRRKIEALGYVGVR